MRRRDFLQWAGRAAGLGWAGASQAGALDGLGGVAARSGRDFGFSIAPGYANDEPVVSLLARHAGVITAENAMKWRAIEGFFGGRDFAPADAVAATAARLGAKLRGHTLAWHQMVPARLAVASSADFVKAQTAHLREMAARYVGRVHNWDVLNEVVNPDDRRSDGLRESVLSRLWGGRVSATLSCSNWPARPTRRRSWPTTTTVWSKTNPGASSDATPRCDCWSNGSNARHQLTC